MSTPSPTAPKRPKRPAIAAKGSPAANVGAVSCAYTELRPLADLRPHPRNPNRHPENQVKLLASVIATAGWRAPIVVSKESGFIVRGHARLLAAKALGYTHAPVDVQSYVTPEAELADLVADNRLAELSTRDIPELTRLVQELNGTGHAELAGFDETGFDDLLAMVEEGLAEPSPARGNGARRAGPRASDDDYALFELVMRADAKKELVAKLNEIRSARGLEKLEDALLVLVREFPSSP